MVKYIILDASTFHSKTYMVPITSVLALDFGFKAQIITMKAIGEVKNRTRIRIRTSNRLSINILFVLLFGYQDPMLKPTTPSKSALDKKHYFTELFWNTSNNYVTGYNIKLN